MGCVLTSPTSPRFPTRQWGRTGHSVHREFLDSTQIVLTRRPLPRSPLSPLAGVSSARLPASFCSLRGRVPKPIVSRSWSRKVTGTSSASICDMPPALLSRSYLQLSSTSALIWGNINSSSKFLANTETCLGDCSVRPFLWEATLRPLLQAGQALLPEPRLPGPLPRLWGHDRQSVSSKQILFPPSSTVSCAMGARRE